MPEPLRAKEAREREMLELLREIRDLLKGAPPPPPLGTVNIGNLDELKDIIKTAMEQYGVLKRANNWLAITVNLDRVREAPTELSELANALGLTIYRSTGIFDLYLQEKRDTKKITVNAITYPQMIATNMDIEKVFIVNTAQSGASAVILKFFRE